VLSASGLRKAHGTRVLFRDASITLPLGRRAALVGSNGTGKTTLLEILAGVHPPDAGEVHRPRDLRIGYLPQDLAEAPEGTVLETTMAGAEHLNALAHRIHELEHQMASADPTIRDRALALYGDEHSRYEQLGGYALLLRGRPTMFARLPCPGIRRVLGLLPSQGPLDRGRLVVRIGRTSKDTERHRREMVECNHAVAGRSEHQA